MAEWIETKKELPTEGVIVKTKIDDCKGCRNEQKLVRRGDMWFIPHKNVYVYYTPTHWEKWQEGKQ